MATNAEEHVHETQIPAPSQPEKQGCKIGQAFISLLVGLGYGGISGIAAFIAGAVLAMIIVLVPGDKSSWGPEAVFFMLLEYCIIIALPLSIMVGLLVGVISAVLAYKKSIRRY